MVHCFLWLLHPWLMEKIIIQGRETIPSKGLIFVMMIRGLLGLKWGEQVVLTTTMSGKIVRYI